MNSSPQPFDTLLSVLKKLLLKEVCWFIGAQEPVASQVGTKPGNAAADPPATGVFAQKAFPGRNAGDAEFAEQPVALDVLRRQRLLEKEQMAVGRLSDDFARRRHGIGGKLASAISRGQDGHERGSEAHPDFDGIWGDGAARAFSARGASVVDFRATMA